MSLTRRGGKALTSRSGGNMPQHDGDTFEYMRSGADRRGCCVYSTTALMYATRYTVNLLTWLADVQTSATGISRMG
jgi:hypothetical protein